MEECRTPTGKPQFTLIRTPNVRSEPIWNSLNVNTINVCCSTPLGGHFRSPHLSPIKNVRARKSPATPMQLHLFKKPLLKHQHQRSPVPIKLPSSNCSFDAFSDDSNDSGGSSNMESSLCRETRRRSLHASNHSFVLNHAANVEEVLMRVGLESYVDDFEQAHINLVDLVSMERDDLKNMGLRKDEDCNRILEALRTL